MNFVHLHTHSDYSCLQSMAAVARLVAKCQSYGMPGLALTDLGNLYGALEFYDLAKAAKLNPIIGCELYVESDQYAAAAAARPQSLRNARPYDYSLGLPAGIYKLVLLAETTQGYANLMRLSTLGFDRVINRLPTVRFEDIYRLRKELICLSGGVGSELFELNRKGAAAKAKRLVEHCRQLFGPDHYFLEIQDHDNTEYTRVTSATLKLAEELDVPVVAANEVFYLDKDDWYSHEIMLCIAQNKPISAKRGMGETERLCLLGRGYHFKSAAEVATSFETMPQLLRQTLAINERCRVELRATTFHMPKFPLPPTHDAKTHLATLTKEGLRELFGRKNKELNGSRDVAETAVEVPDIYWERLARELEVINSMGFAEYFLIVADLVDAAKTKKILVGPGRGSVVGSLVAYALGITDIDPIRYNLLFERFLTTKRVSMPDIDIDFQDDRREEVITYLRERYGETNCCQIITYTKLKARAVFKDICRVFNIDFAAANRLSALIGTRAAGADVEVDVTGGQQVAWTALRTAYERVAEFKSEVLGNETLKQVYAHALKLENLTRQTGVHPAGVVIADAPLAQYVPLAKNEDKIVISQYDGRYLESHCGLLKMDILGLRTLALIKDAVEQLHSQEGVHLKWQDVPLSDEPTFALFAAGMTMGVFQFESDGMTRYLRELRPDNIEELIAMNALYRPGPMAWIPVFIAKKHRRTPTFQNDKAKQHYERLEHLCQRFPLLKEVLKHTNLLPVYQEQIMQICRVFAGFSLEEADNIRKAMGKKNKKLITSLRTKFIEGAQAQDHQESDAVFLYDQIIESFGGYGFNKSHAAGYAVLAYRVAYIKAHYPAVFMAAFLNTELNALRQEKMQRVLQECEQLNVQLQPPNINTATVTFKHVAGGG